MSIKDCWVMYVTIFGRESNRIFKNMGTNAFAIGYNYCIVFFDIW